MLNDFFKAEVGGTKHPTVKFFQTESWFGLNFSSFKKSYDFYPSDTKQHEENFLKKFNIIILSKP